VHLCLVSLNKKVRSVALFVHCFVVHILPAKSARDGTDPVLR